MCFSSCRKKYSVVQLLMSFENFLIRCFRAQIVAASRSACCRKYIVFATSRIGYELQNEMFTNTYMSSCGTDELYFYRRVPGVVDRVVNIIYRYDMTRTYMICHVHHAVAFIYIYSFAYESSISKYNSLYISTKFHRLLLITIKRVENYILHFAS